MRGLPDQQDWLTTVFVELHRDARRLEERPVRHLVRAADKEPDGKKRDDGYIAAQKILTQEAPSVLLLGNEVPS